MIKNSILKFALLASAFMGLLFTGCEDSDPVEELMNEDVIELRSTIVDGTYYILNRNSGKGLDVSASDGNVQQYSYWGGANQKFIITGVGNGYYRISPTSASGKAFDIAYQSTENGANLGTYSYWGGANQQFSFVNVGGTYCKIVNRNSGKVLDVAGQSTSNGANIQQYSYWGGTNQQWQLVPLEGNAHGQISWTLTTSGVPADVEARITAAMNAAVARYNKWGDWPARTLNVQYNTGVPTADGNINGTIRFGANSSYQTECTAMHEMGHTYGVGTSWKWSSPLVVNNKYVGANGLAAIQLVDGESASISTGGSHFWPYGLNYNTEWSEASGDKHAQILWGMYQDGLY